MTEKFKVAYYDDCRWHKPRLVELAVPVKEDHAVLLASVAAKLFPQHIVTILESNPKQPERSRS